MVWCSEQVNGNTLPGGVGDIGAFLGTQPPTYPALHPKGWGVEEVEGGRGGTAFWHLPFKNQCDSHCAVWCHDYPSLKQMHSLASPGQGRRVANPMHVPFPQVQKHMLGSQ